VGTLSAFSNDPHPIRIYFKRETPLDSNDTGVSRGEDPMANNVNNTTNVPKFNERRGLYRVWVPLHDDARAPLISIWIDPDLRAFEFCTEEKNPEGGACTSFAPV
jgi:hypothetical protein